MAVLTFSIRSSGGDYSLLSTALAAEATDLVADGDSHVFELYNDWPSGLSDNSAFSGYVTGASNTITITSPVGHRHNGTDPTSGFHFNNGSTTDTLRPISTANHIILNWVSFVGGRNNLSANNGGWQNAVITNIILKDNGSGDMLTFFGSSAKPNLIFTNNLLINPFDDGGLIDVGEFSNNTIIGAGNRGLVALGGIFKNNFIFGSSGVDISNQGGTHVNNATGDATATGTINYPNRTSSDFADFANADYRTSSSSELATGGEGGTWIGYILEQTSSNFLPTWARQANQMIGYF